MLFKYTTVDPSGSEQSGLIEAAAQEVAIASLQRRGFVVSSIKEVSATGVLNKSIDFFDRVAFKDVVILSRQIATLFNAQVSALNIFTLLADETENLKLKSALIEIVKDLEGGTTISKAMSRHPKIFSSFYVNMVASGEESGKLSDTFAYLADYLERNYELTSKAKHALIYPAFVVGTFIAVMVMMLTYIIPKIGAIITDSGQEIPAYTKMVLGASSFLVNYGYILLALIVVGIVALWRYAQTLTGRALLAHLRLGVPYLGTLYRKLYLSRLADNMSTLLSSGVPMVRALEITSAVIDNRIYSGILDQAITEVRGGKPLSEALSGNEEIPRIMTQMIRVGEESGKLSEILETLSKFYQREVSNAVDTLVGLIEPVMIVLLGLGVGTLLASVLIPIYNISSGI
jgi:type IV pilus assembly protein PilC